MLIQSYSQARNIPADYKKTKNKTLRKNKTPHVKIDLLSFNSAGTGNMESNMDTVEYASLESITETAHFTLHMYIQVLLCWGSPLP